MAGSTKGKRAAAKPKTSPPKSSAAKAAGKPKAAAAKPATARAASARAPSSKPSAATKSATPPAPAMLTISKEARLMPGCGFGIDQAILIGTIDVRLPDGFDIRAIEPLLEEFVLDPPNGERTLKDAVPEAELVARLHAWHAAIQRGVNVPVFGNCRLWDKGIEGGARRIAFALPSHARPASMAALQFVADAVSEIVGAARPDEVMPGIRKRFANVRQTLARYALLGINPIHFVESAHALGIEHSLWADQIWAFGMGRHRLLLNSTVTSATPHIGVATAKDKLKCSAVLRAAGLPAALSALAPNADAAARIAQKIGYPVVVKPANLDQGAGVTAGIEDEGDLRRAFVDAAKVSQRVMVEKHHFGRDYRVTVLHGKVIKVMDRKPGGVTGDGRSTVAELVDRSNDRDKAMRAQLRRQRAPMVIDEEARKLLEAHGYDAQSVIPEGEFVALRRRANISAGGTYEVLPPAAIHPDNARVAINAAVALGLDLAGVDIISGDPAKSWRETGGIICEVNAQPQIGFRDTEGIFGEILVAAMGGKGAIPAHLAITQEGLAPPAPLPRLAAGARCNAASIGTAGWVSEGGELGPFANAFRAGRGILLDPRTKAALVVMSEKEALQFGLPAAHFASIRLLGDATWQPQPALQQLIAGHSERILRQGLGETGAQAAGAASRAS